MATLEEILAPPVPSEPTEPEPYETRILGSWESAEPVQNSWRDRPSALLTVFDEGGVEVATKTLEIRAVQQCMTEPGEEDNGIGLSLSADLIVQPEWVGMRIEVEVAPSAALAAIANCAGIAEKWSGRVL